MKIDAADREDVAFFNRKRMFLNEISSKVVVVGGLSTTVQDSGCARMTLVGESLHPLGLSCGSKWSVEIIFVNREGYR